MDADVLTRNNVTLGGQPMVFAHGYGCDQNMWRFVAPAFEDRYRTVLFDFVGAGGSELSAYDPERYGSPQGYAADVLDVVRALDLHDVIFVGHSVSAMIGVLAASGEPGRFAALVLVAPSPRYIGDEGYAGAFTEADIEDLLTSLDRNYLGWSATMAPVIMGNTDRPELGAELTASFCRTDPKIARRFARATFLSDNRADLAGVQLPTLALQLVTGDRIFYQTHAAPMLLMQGMLREIAVQVVAASGSRLPVLMNALLKRGDDGQPLVVRTVVFDARERLAYERELIAAQRQAEEAEGRARALAEILQRSFLPPAIVTVPGVDIGGAYRPAGDGTEVGGDFYDVFRTSLQTWGIVLGDVCGKGASAAVVTARARYTVRAEALHVPSPAAVLEGLRQALLTYYPKTFCTVLYLLLDQVPEGCRLTMATGGRRRKRVRGRPERGRHGSALHRRGDGSPPRRGVLRDNRNRPGARRLGRPAGSGGVTATRCPRGG